MIYARESCNRQIENVLQAYMSLKPITYGLFLLPPSSS